MELRYGILSTSSIAPRFIAAVRACGKGEILAVSSRSLSKAQEKAAQLEIPTAYGSHEELLRDEKVNIVYISNVNAQHYPWAKKALLAGKHVICEKPCTTSYAHTKELYELAKEKGLRVALNPSPASPDLAEWPLDKGDWLILNEVEGEDLTGCAEPQAMLDALASRLPHTAIVLTLGKDGAFYRDARQQLHQPAIPVQAVDTTAAGDTFTGYFLQAVLAGEDPAKALLIAAKAAAIAVTRHGAGASIPVRDEV